MFGALGTRRSLGDASMRLLLAKGDQMQRESTPTESGCKVDGTPSILGQPIAYLEVSWRRRN